MAEIGEVFIRVKPDTSEFVAELRRLADAFEGVGPTVFVLWSKTYAPASGPIVGIFASREAAERYKNEATPPVEDGDIREWAVAA